MSFIETQTVSKEDTPISPNETVVNVRHGEVAFCLQLGRSRVVNEETERRYLKWAIPGFLAVNPYWREAAEGDIVSRIRDKDFYQAYDRLAFGFLGVAISDLGFKIYEEKGKSLSDEGIRNSFREVRDSEKEISWINPGYFINLVQPWWNELWLDNREWEKDELYNQIALVFSERIGSRNEPVDNEINRDEPFTNWPAIVAHMTAYARNIGSLSIANLWGRQFEMQQIIQIERDFAAIRGVFSKEELSYLAGTVEELCGLRLNP